MAAEKKQQGQDVSKKSESHEHGSVLMQFVKKKEEPKQLTVGAKGKQIWILSLGEHY